jgi:hypothetical protein
MAAKIGAVALGFGAYALFILAPVPIDEIDLAIRVASAKPSWESYQEDIKGQIGARAAAQWEGEAARAWTEAGAVFVQFQLAGPWVERSVSVPVLLRDPSLAVHRAAEVTREGALTTYRFDLPDLEERMLAWVEVHYPHHTRRMMPERPGD